MKKIFSLFMNLNCALLVLLFDFHPFTVTAQSTNYIEFLPLQVGNIWVYECSTSGIGCVICTGRTKVSITQSSVINGKTYYQSEIITRVTSGSCSNCGPNLMFSNLIRVDTQSANVLKYSTPGCTYSPNEIMLDSFKARLNDSISVNCIGPAQNQRYVCKDTNSINIFGSIKQARNYVCTLANSDWGRKYARGIGLYSAYYYVLYALHYTCYYSLYLKGCIVNGVLYGDTSMLMSIKQISSDVPVNYSLLQNYPNPFNPTTKIRFDIRPPLNPLLSKEGKDGWQDAGRQGVVLKVYDILGREIQTLVNEPLQPGTYEVEFDPEKSGQAGLPSGVYYYKLNAGDYSETKKMVLIK